LGTLTWLKHNVQPIILFAFDEMNSIYNNPFRILDLPITAGEREIAKQISTLSTYAEMGKSKSFDTDFPFLPPIVRTPSIIEEAKKQIEQSESKLLFSLFWYWKNNTVDELAFELLKEGNTAKAINIWEKSILANKHIVNKPVVYIENAFNNLFSWSQEKDEDHHLIKNEDEYIVNRKKSSSSSIPCVYVNINNDDNWTIECDTKWLSGIDNNLYGIVFGRDKGNYFTFGIAANGYYSFDRFVEYKYQSLIPWKQSKSILKKSKNHIKITKSDNELNFYINHVLVDSYANEPLYGKSFGFSVNNNQEVSFKNFKFCKLIEDESYGEGLNIMVNNYSHIKNLSNLYLCLAASNGTIQLEYLKKGIALAKYLFASDNITNYSKLIAGDRYIYNSEKTIQFYIDNIIESLKNHLDKPDGIPKSELIRSFSSYPVEAKQFINSRFVVKQIRNIDKEIETTQKLRRSLAESSVEDGIKLMTNTKNDLNYLKSSLGENDFQYQIVTDKLSNELVQCGIDYYNAVKNDEVCLSLYEYAVSIAITDRAKRKAIENLDSCKEWIKNKHLYFCWFCGKNQSDPSSTFIITMYKVTNRQYKRVQYQYKPVSIQRCPDCEKIHKKNHKDVLFVMIACTIVGLVGGIIVYGYWFAGIIAGAVLGWIGSAILVKDNLKEAGTKGTNNRVLNKCPVITNMRLGGWSLDKPTA
jgi:hypothetical protein